MKKVFAGSLGMAFVFSYLFFAWACNSGADSSGPYDSLSLKIDLKSPQLSPEESMKKMHLEDGFEVKLVAAEPLVVAPVALSFDEKGRIWVVEMQNYMPDTLGVGEDQPIGKVVILSDTNNDGAMDKRDVFLDSLILPRAICLIEKGILVAEPPMLWHYDIVNDRPTNKTLIDSTYATGGNVEHQPNGLFRALDNWIYSANSPKRYRKQGSKWLIETTHSRGQWGISQDDNGRLFYNSNSTNLVGDYFSPALGATNKNQRSVNGYKEKIINDNRVYPVRPTPGVNRGYQEGILDDSLRLVKFTAACGPVIYSDPLFGKEYYGNAFVAEPSANLIKRNILKEEGNIIGGEEAYENKEFLASEDERFRPVNLYTGPEGALYVIDMYRGIIQHKTYLTPYLKNEIKDRNLTKPLSAGRIYKIQPKKSVAKAPAFSKDATALLQLLQSQNGTVRNMAQQVIVDDKMVQLEPVLRQNLSGSNPLLVIHSLWALEGLGVLQTADVIPLLNNADFNIKRQALSVIPSVINKQNYNQLIPVLEQLMNTDSLSAPYIGFLVHYIQPINAAKANEIMDGLVKNYPDNIYVADAVISNLYNNEAAFYKKSLKINPDTSLAINKRLDKVLNDIQNEKNNRNSKEIAKAYPKGAALFNTVCQTCHGADGNGISNLAPPLNHSEWILGDKNILIPIVLYGLSGPVKVAGHLYKAPEINGEMPGIGQNKDYSDEDIAQLLSYVRNIWSNKADKINAEDIKKTRQKFPGRQKTFTAEELSKLK